MYKPIKRDNSFRLTITHKGKRYSITQSTEEDCLQQAELLLINLQAHPITSIIQYATLFDLYNQAIGSKMRGYSYIQQQRKSFKTYWGRLAYKPIRDIKPKDITQWRNKRLTQVKSSTVQRQMCLYSSVFNYAVKELFILDENPFNKVSKPSKAKPRRKRITSEYEQLVLHGLNYTELTTPKTPRQYVAWCFLFALETAMRKGEILSIQPSNIYDDYIHLSQTKNGEIRDVPLNTQAKLLLSLLPKNNEKLIPHNSNSFRLVWERNLKRVGLNGVITFHDTRHEAITRMVHRYQLPVEILAKITGHKDIKTLINTYYNPSASEIAKMLN